MGLLDIIEIIIIAVCAITYGFMLYFKVKGNVLGAVSELIALAEETGLTGSEKMAQVVAALYEKVPGPLKKILNEPCLEKIAQTIFNWMRKYSDEYQKSQQKEPTPIKSEDEIRAEVAAAAADLVSELLKLTVAELKEKAEADGVELNGATRKDDIMKAFLAELLKKAQTGSDLRPDAPAM